MLNKIALTVALFQLLIVVIMADSCNQYFETTRSSTDGPNSVQFGVCFPFVHLGIKFHSAWIEDIPVGAGYPKFYSGHTCEPEKLVTEGSSPISLRQRKSIGSVFIQSCK